MGQKTNPNIFRLGVNKKWKTEFFEKKTKEFAYFTFVDLEVKSFIERFLTIHGLMLHEYKIHHTNSVVNIYVSYAIKTDFKLNHIKQENKLKLVSRANKREFIYIDKKRKIKNDSNLLSGIKKYLEGHGHYFKGFSPTYKFINTLETIQQNNLKIENKIQKFLKSIELFKNSTVFINFKCINKNFNLTLEQKKSLQKKIMLLQKFKFAPFFEEGINLIFLSVYKQNSSKLLTKFIEIQLKKIKRHKYFMTFLRKTLAVFVNSSFSKVKGVKVKIKGRFNGAPRAKHKFLKIGDIPVQTIDSKVDYSAGTVHNSNGSYGIKVWVVGKN